MTIPKSVFREYDVRGIVPTEINKTSIRKICLALGTYFTRRHKGKSIKLIIGHDPRDSSMELYEEAVKTLSEFPRCTVIKGGLMTTPMLYFTTSFTHADGGIIITASHNPLNYNGLKVVRERAINISGKEIGEIIAKTSGAPKVKTSRMSEKGGMIQDQSKELRMAYGYFLEKLLSLKQPVRIVIDCSNSPVATIVKEIKKKELTVIYMNETPGRHFSAHGPNPLKAGATDALKKKVLKEKADFGAIVDGDADRIMFIDNKARPVHPDVAAFILMNHFKPPFVMDARTGWLIRNSGKPIIFSRVGHTNVKKLMRAKNVSFASETSGHYFFRNRFGKDIAHNDSALQALMYLINQIGRLKHSGKTLGDYIDSLPTSCRYEMNFEVKNIVSALTKVERAYAEERKIKITHLDGVTIEAGKGEESFWFNLRPSANEPLLRLSLEAHKQEILNRELRKISSLISSQKYSAQGVF